MATEKKSKKSLLVGIIGAVVILALALVLLLTQCSGQEPAPTGPSGAVDPTGTTAPSDLSTDLYWNADRAEYDGKSEAGMSSRVPESDGYYHIRFILDGQEVTLKAVDRKLINKIDSMDLMGLVFDEDGIIVDAVDPEDMPLELVAWKFYVQSSGGNLIKLNSSKSFEGMEFLLECTDNTRIYDMTGTSGPLGTEEEVVIYDRVIAIQNLAGELTHVFIYDRSNYMLTHEAPCVHCEQTVTWYEWTKTDVLPDESGHYQLMNDITVTKQLSLASDTTLCLDLNGHRVDGAKDTRILSLHNPGVTLALMDTSEGQTGVMAGHSEASPQGGVIWVRYGAFYMYGGTLDGSDMVSRLNGTVVQVPKNAFFYMHGGTIIGGTAAPQYNEETGKYTYGLGGSIQITGTMRMYGGTIRDGKAPAAYYYSNGKYTIARGMGGNIFMASGSVLEITGGEILNGHAGNVGGNIMMDGTAELIISGGTVAGGKADAKVTGKHGANIYCPAKGTITMTGGRIHSGLNLSGGGGNIYLAGHMEMSGGHIYSGVAATSGGNIMMSGSATMVLSGGTVTGGAANGKSAGNGGGNIHIGGDKAVLALCGAKVSGGKAIGLVNADGSTTGGDGGNINLNKGTLQFSAGIVTDGSATGNGDGIYVAWNAKGAYLSHYFKLYGNGDADITRSANTSKEVSRIFLGNWEGNGENGPIVISRIGGKAGSVLVEPIKDAVLTAEDAAWFESTVRALPVILSEEGNLILSTEASLGEGDHLHCLCGGSISGHTCTDTGFVSVDAEEFLNCFIANGSNYDLAGSLNLCLTEDVTLNTEYRLMGATLNLCLNGHTITLEDQGRITSNGTTGDLRITDCGESGKIVAAEGCRSSILCTYNGSLTLYGGTVDGSACAAGAAGVVNIYMDDDSLTVYGGTIIGGRNAQNGGAIYASGNVTIAGGTIRDGKASVSGGNIYMRRGLLTLSGGTVTGGEAADLSGGIYLAYNTEGLVLTGNAKILDNAGSDVFLGSHKNNRITLKNWEGNGGDHKLVVGKLNAVNGSVLVSPAENVTLTEADLARFAPAEEGAGITLYKGDLVLHSVITGDTHSHDDLRFVEVDAERFGKLWIRNSSSFDLPTDMNICLTEDLVLSQEYRLNGKTLNLCLNGHTITMEGNGRFTANGGTGSLDLFDCGETGKIRANTGCRSSILYTYGGSLSIHGGTVDGSASAEGTGGTIFLGMDGDSLTITGGTVLGSRKAERGGAIYTNFNVTATITGGTVSGGKASVSGGNIYMGRGLLVLSGGTVSGGEAADLSGGIYLGYNARGLELSGSALICGNTGTDILLGSKAANRIILKGWTGNSTQGKLVIGKLGSVTGSVIAVPGEGVTLTEADAALFTGPGEDSSVTLYGGNLVLYASPIGTGHNHCFCGGTESADHTCEGLEFADGNADSFTSLWIKNGDKYDLAADTTLCLTGDLTLSNEYRLNGKTLNLCLNGHTVTMEGSGRITANGGGKLNLSDCTGTGKIAAAEGCNTSLLYTWNGRIGIYGGTIDAALCAQGNGGAIYVGVAGDSLTVAGGTVIGSKTAVYGGAIHCNVDATVTVSGGEIVGGKAQNGGSICMNAGTLNICGGTVSGGEASGHGGNIYLDAASLNLTSGEIRNGTALLSGNIHMSNNASTVTITGGTVSGGKATGTETGTGLGGNIHVIRGTLTITGGTVTGGEASGKPRENDQAGITGGIYLAWNAGTFTLGGDAVVSGNTGADICLGTNSTSLVHLKDWTGSGTVLAKLDGTSGTVLVPSAAASDAARFQSHDKSYTIFFHNDALILYPALGAADHSHDGQNFVTVTAKQFEGLWLANGDMLQLPVDLNLCLGEDVTLSKIHSLNGRILNLCLGGHTVTMEDQGRFLAQGADLTIYDCADGSITAAEGAANAFLYAEDATITLRGGTVDASAISTGANGGAVYVNTASASFIMEGGILKGAAKANYGAAVHVQKGHFVMRGGEITGGTAVRGGGVYLHDTGSTFTMEGGSIHGGNATQYGGNVGLNRGSFTMTGGQIYGGKLDTVTGFGANVNIGYNVTDPVTVSGDARIYDGTNGADLHLGQNPGNGINHFIMDGWNGNGTGCSTMTVSQVAKAATTVGVPAEGRSLTMADKQKIAAYSADFQVAFTGTNLELVGADKDVHCICGGTLAGHDHVDTVFTTVDGTSFMAYWELDPKNPDTYNLTASCNLSLAEGITLSHKFNTNGFTLNLCLNGQTITLNDKGRFASNGTTGVLNITDTGNGMIKADGCEISPLYTWKGKLNIYGGTIDASGCKSGNNGGAIYVGVAGDVLNIYGGTVIGSPNTTGSGGSIYCKVNATVNLYGGTVRDGKASTGGNIYMETGTLNLMGTTVSGGEATGAGGGNIYLKSGTLNITGGSVSGGKATGTKENTGLGGNIHGVEGTATISGSAIVTGGSASGYGTGDKDNTGLSGGIYVGWNFGTLKLSGGAKVHGNTNSDIYLTSKEDYMLTLEDWTGNSDGGKLKIGKAQGTDNSKLVAGEALDLFTCAHSGYGLQVKNGNIVMDLLHYHGDTRYETVTAEEFLSCFVDNTLTGSHNLCLLENVTVSAEYKTGANTLNLCLNGHTITTTDNDSRITVNGGGTLNIYDCTGTGSITAAAESKAGFVFAHEGSLNLYSGTINASAISRDGSDSGAVYVNLKNAAFTMYGGTVTGAAKAGNGGAVYVASGTFELKGGTVNGGTATNGGTVYVNSGSISISGGTIYGGTAQRGGAVFVNTGSFHMTGGEISGGTASASGTTGRGGCVYLHADGSSFSMEGGIIHDGNASYYGGNVGLNYGTFTMTGGEIYDGDAPQGAGVNIGYPVDDENAVTLSGSAKIYNNRNGDNAGQDLYLGQKENIYLNLGQWDGNGTTPLKIARSKPGENAVVVKGASLTYADKAKFVSFDDAYTVVFNGTDLVLRSSEYLYTCVCGGTLLGTEGHACVDIPYTKVTGAEFLAKLSEEGTATYYLALTEGVTISAEYKLAGKTVYLCLNGQTVTMTGSGRITANGGGTLNICDGSANQTGTIVAASGSQFGFLYTYNGKINLYGGTIDARSIKLDITNTTNSGGAVFVDLTDDVFTMYGGTIYGGTIYRAGAVYADEGSFIMNGGTIQGGTATNGGCVATNKGRFTMNGGIITGGTATNGAGVMIGYGSDNTLTLSGDAMIYGNNGVDVLLNQNKKYNQNYLDLDNWTGYQKLESAMVIKSGANYEEGATIAKSADGSALSEDLLKKISYNDGTMGMELSEDKTQILLTAAN